MSIELLLAPVGAGKTEQALERIVWQSEHTPFARIMVLLATERQVNEFRNRLIDYTAEKPVFFNVEFFTFYDLYTRILEAAGQPTRSLAEAARLRLLRVLIQRLVDSGELEVYSKIASKPGFVRIVANFIYELKQAIIEPQQFSDITDELLGQRQQDTELALIYHTYQNRLREHDIVDREGEGWLALARLEQDKTLHTDVDLLVVDGYDQFTPLQAQIVALMAERVGEVLVTLTTVPEREATVGKRFVQAQQALQRACDAYQMPLAIRKITGQVEQRHSDLQHLADSIFRLGAATLPATDAVRFIAAPDATVEIQAILRHVKQLLLDPDADTRPDDILIVLRDYARYQNAIRETARVYGLPVALHPGHALGDTPPIRELISLITLHDTNINLTDFLRRPLMDALGSAYFNIAGIGRRETELLDRISREFAVVGGRGAWLEAIDLAAQEQVTGEDDDMRKRPALIDEPMREHLRTSLSAFFDAVTPPAQATVKMYVAWLEDVIGHDPLTNPDVTEDDSPGTLDMIRQVRRKAPAHVISRDLAALEEFKKVLKSLLSAQLLLRTLEQTRDEITWAEFLADLRSTVERTTIENAPEREGRILITTVTDARGLPHKHVFVPGLSEGIFPLRQPEDPLYLDSERRQLSNSGAGILAASERAADDGLFYEMISLARDTLTLSRPTVKDGAPWVESHLWRAVADVFDDAADRIAASEIRIGEITGITEA
ncbi:MAG: UvrD-helicase domain-containing protein, partial [Chloroflexota bacterium]